MLQTHVLLWCCNNVQHWLSDTLREVCILTCMDKFNVRLEKLKTGYRLPPTGDRPFKMLGTGPLLGQALQNAWDRPFSMLGTGPLLGQALQFLFNKWIYLVFCSCVSAQACLLVQ